MDNKGTSLLKATPLIETPECFGPGLGSIASCSWGDVKHCAGAGSDSGRAELIPSATGRDAGGHPLTAIRKALEQGLEITAELAFNHTVPIWESGPHTCSSSQPQTYQREFLVKFSFKGNAQKP